MKTYNGVNLSTSLNFLINLLQYNFTQMKQAAIDKAPHSCSKEVMFRLGNSWITSITLLFRQALNTVDHDLFENFLETIQRNQNNLTTMTCISLQE